MSNPQAKPESFLDSRTRWTMLKHLLFLEPLPGGSRWAAAFGSLLLFSFTIQVVTGVLLSFNYSPSAETAWPSVNYIQNEVASGSFIRAVHHWGSSAMVVLLLFHLTQVFVWGAYKKPREFTWMTGVILLSIVLALAFTGYLLPWDQKAYWATKVGLSIASTTPVIGDDTRTFMQGGPELGNLTLTRFFTLHTMVLPGMVMAMIGLHIFFFRIHGVTPPWWESESNLKKQEEPFWPKQVLKDLVFALVFLLALGIWAYYRPAPLEEPADPSKPYEARPEWYFMFMFQLLRYFHGPYEIVGTFVLPVVFFLVLFFWPFIDRNPHHDPRKRPFAMGLLASCILGLIGLTFYAIVSDVRMTETQQSTTKQAPKESAGPIQRADIAKIFSTQCAACHGIDGSAKLTRTAMPTIPDFTSLAWQMTQTELEITHRIQEGKEPQMPAYRDKLSEREMIALTIYIRAFSPEANAPTPTVQPGGAPAATGPDVKPGTPSTPGTTVAKNSNPTTPPDASQLSAVQIYRAYCLACHDSDGKGKTVKVAMPDIPDFTDPAWNDKRTNADLNQSILNGKGKFMLAMKDKLSPADTEKMIQYIRQFRAGKLVVAVETVKPPPPPPTLPVVEKGGKPVSPTVPNENATAAARMNAATGLYRQYCLTCHGTEGMGKEIRAAMPAIPDFTNRDWQAKNQPPQMAASILDGKGTLMPAFRGRVTEDQSRDLAAYVRAFGPVKVPKVDANASDFEKQFKELEGKWDELNKQLKEQDKGKPPEKK